jgi:uncharacterized protein (TIGR00255 family)
MQSMTGFGRAEGQVDGTAWAWEWRSVNGRGLDLRFRLPSGFDALEPALREAAGRVLKRGNVTANLTTKREDRAGALVIDQAALDQMLTAALALSHRIPGAEPPRAEVLLGLPGVLRAAGADSEGVTEALLDAAGQGFLAALAGLAQAREAEGARLAVILAAQLDEIAALCRAAHAEAADQPAAQQARMLQTVQALLAELPALPAERIAQEVAVLAAKSDVREELDRLGAHIEAARALLAETDPVGRRFDFLVQEFNREANTLCSKSASVALTAVGLKLKAALEQLREQVQNIE